MTTNRGRSATPGFDRPSADPGSGVPAQPDLWRAFVPLAMCLVIAVPLVVWIALVPSRGMIGGVGSVALGLLLAGSLATGIVFRFRGWERRALAVPPHRFQVVTVAPVVGNGPALQLTLLKVRTEAAEQQNTTVITARRIDALVPVPGDEVRIFDAGGNVPLLVQRAADGRWWQAERSFAAVRPAG